MDESILNGLKYLENPAIPQRNAMTSTNDHVDLSGLGVKNKLLMDINKDSIL